MPYFASMTALLISRRNGPQISRLESKYSTLACLCSFDRHWLPDVTCKISSKSVHGCPAPCAEKRAWLGPSKLSEKLWSNFSETEKRYFQEIPEDFRKQYLKDVGGVVFLAKVIVTKSQLVIKGRFVHF